MLDRNFSPVDKFLINLDHAVITLFGRPATSGRTDPAKQIQEQPLNESEKKHVAGLMRVNHTGEVCAQGLYQGQAMTAKLPDVREKMEQAAIEENDHLAWTGKRLVELDSHKSILNPLFYAGSFAIGALAGKIGDRWSLGFVAETEHQVVKHLQSHLEKLPEQDEKSRVILEQMKQDEAKHATTALDHGGASLPFPIKLMMKITSNIMTKSTHRI
jgi:3-demethoxyubiquinol 3-hydroxylase